MELRLNFTYTRPNSGRLPLCVCVWPLKSNRIQIHTEETNSSSPSIPEPNEAKCELATRKTWQRGRANRPTPAKAPRQLLCGISGGLLPLSLIMSWHWVVLEASRGWGFQIWAPAVEISTAFATFDGFHAKISALWICGGWFLGCFVASQVVCCLPSPS